MTYDESQLIADSQRGDVRAFNVLVEHYQTRLYNLCYRMLGDPDAAADVTQDAFLSAFRNIRRYRGGSFAAWMMRIATNGCYDQLRARQRRPTSSIDALLDDEDHAPRQFEDSGESPDERSLRNELAGEIQRGLDQLDADQRVAIVLSDIQGFSYDEISAVTGWPLGTVKSRLSRGRAQLRNVLRQGELLPARYRQTPE
ncbi:MAG: sigma-70 family RNA polymerase sigma factor [Chloroflexi bacterium]|nr:sigma-70 family RNA polymerase sigma factor [Chloroflexota bacterium]